MIPVHLQRCNEVPVQSWSCMSTVTSLDILTVLELDEDLVNLPLRWWVLGDSEAKSIVHGGVNRGKVADLACIESEHSKGSVQILLKCETWPKTLGAVSQPQPQRAIQPGLSS